MTTSTRRGAGGLVQMAEALPETREKALARALAAQARMAARGEAAPGPACRSCGDTGWVGYDVPLADPRFGQVFPCSACRPIPTLDELFGGIEVPEEYTSLAKRQLRAAIQVARQVAETGEPRWLVLSGPNGSGKTMLALAIHRARRLIAREGSVYERGDRLVDWLRETQGKDAPATLDERMRQIASWHRLVLDEMGKGETEWAWAPLEKAVNQRYETRSGLVITTNADPLSARGPFPPAVRSRFKDAGLCQVVYLADVPDFRPRLGTERV